MNNIRKIWVLVAIVVLGACASNQQLENSFDPSNFASSAGLTFSSPNFSAFHKPPLMSGFAYIESYKLTDLCLGDYDYVGKTTVSRSNKTLESRLPAGQVVLKVGYHAIGATGGGLSGSTFYFTDIDPSHSYKITLTENRPFVTSYKVDFKEITLDGISVPMELLQIENLTSRC